MEGRIKTNGLANGKLYIETFKEDFNNDITEPYDPAYLTDAPSVDDVVSAADKRFYRKVSILQNKLRKAHVQYEWLDDWECFRVARYFSEYPTYRYVRVNEEENDYSFGTEKEDLVFDSKVSVVVKAVADWLNGTEDNSILASVLMKKFRLTKKKFREMFMDGTIYSLWDGEIEFDI